MDEFVGLDLALLEIAASGAAEVREDGRWLADLSAMRCEVHRKGNDSLLSLSSEDKNLTRRVLRVKEQTPHHIVLEVQHFGRKKPGRLEFVMRDSRRAP